MEIDVITTCNCNKESCKNCIKINNIIKKTKMNKKDLDKISIDITNLPLTDNICIVIDEKLKEIKKHSKKIYRKTFPSKIRYSPFVDEFINTIIDADLKRLKKKTLEEYVDQWKVLDFWYPCDLSG